jgi:hypothetical protein
MKEMLKVRETDGTTADVSISNGNVRSLGELHGVVILYTVINASAPVPKVTFSIKKQVVQLLKLSYFRFENL